VTNAVSPASAGVHGGKADDVATVRFTVYVPLAPGGADGGAVPRGSPSLEHPPTSAVIATDAAANTAHSFFMCSSPLARGRKRIPVRRDRPIMHKNAGPEEPWSICCDARGLAKA
jgi:hypothetical protein